MGQGIQAQCTSTTTIPQYKSAQTQTPTRDGNATVCTKQNKTFDVYKSDGQLCQGGLTSKPGAVLYDTSQGQCKAYSSSGDFLNPTGG